MTTPRYMLGGRRRARRSRTLSLASLVAILCILVFIFWPWPIHAQTAQTARTAPAPGLPQPGVTAGGAAVHTVSLFANPAFLLLGVMAAGAILEALVLTSLFHRADATRKRIVAAFGWAVHPFTGPDGRPSFSKIVDLLIIGAYWSGAPIPQGLAIVVVASAHGTKVLLAVVEKMNLGVTSADSSSNTTAHSTTTSTTITRAERETAAVDATIGRGPAGEPLRSNPPIAGARMPADDPAPLETTHTVDPLELPPPVAAPTSPTPRG